MKAHLQHRFQLEMGFCCKISLFLEEYTFLFLRIDIEQNASGGIGLKGIVEERAVELGNYILENKTTVRKAAKKFGISKSTVHKDVADRLKSVNPQLYCQVRKILEINKAQRHIRGGMATRRKYRGKQETFSEDIV